jgi:hypothetical protein
MTIMRLTIKVRQMLKKVLFIVASALTISLLDSSLQPIFPALGSAHEMNVDFSSPFYLHYLDILPGQLRYSSQNVEEKVKGLIKKERATWNEEAKKWEFKYNDGKSALPKEESLPVVKGPMGYVLADGHHDVLSNLALGVEWIPIRIVKDLSQLSEQEFWSQAEAEGWVYLYDLKGEKKLPPRNFNELVNDPNRYFAAIMARKCKVEGNLEDSIGADYPLWIKIGKDIPFIEFMISDIMMKHGLIYSDEMEDHPPVEFVEKVRDILKEDHPAGLRVIPTRIHYSQIQLTAFK